MPIQLSKYICNIGRIFIWKNAYNKYMEKVLHYCVPIKIYLPCNFQNINLGTKEIDFYFVNKDFCVQHYERKNRRVP